MNGTADEIVEALKRKAPEYLDLLTAKTEAEFNAAFDHLLELAVRRLEASKSDYVDLGENALNRILAGFVNCPGLSVTAETHSNGHVDLTFSAVHSSPIWTKLGEAKLYDGPAYHIKGLGQLVSRYTTGRDSTGLMICYVRVKDIVGKLQSIQDQMDLERPEQQTGPTTKGPRTWTFRSEHKHTSGVMIGVSHVGVNMHVP